MKRFCTLIVFLFSVIITTHAQLVITEISYNPPESGPDSLEYIELYNAGQNAISLKDYRFTKGITYTFPDTAIQAGQYMLVVKNTNTFLNAYGLVALGWSQDPLSGNALNNSGEPVEITDAAGNVVLLFTYSRLAPWPTEVDGTDGNGKSIELCSPLSDPNDGTNWKVSENDLGFMINGKQIFGTPGAANSIPPCGSVQPDVVVEVSSNFFTPKDITIDVGQTVRWENTGGHHNVNGSQSTYPNNPASFGNGEASEELWTYDFTFTIAGVYQYQCDPHVDQGMTGTVTVVEEPVMDEFPLRTIAEMKGVNNLGRADSLDVKCTLIGIVHGVNLRPDGLQFTIIDVTNSGKGIGVFSNSNNFGYTVTEGDEVILKGQIGQFNGLTQIVVSSVQKISENNPLISPKSVSEFLEEDESSLILVENLTFVNQAQWTGTGPGFNVTMTNGNQNFEIRIDNDIDAYSMPIPQLIPGASWYVTGLLGQFDSSSPFTEDYQLIPRYMADFTAVSSTNDKELDVFIKLLPNPATDQLIIQTDSNPDLIQLFNTDGKLISVYKNTLSLDLSELSKGLYILKIMKGQKYTVRRVIKF
ncbi:MAG: lamin tail domain-containing protein [Saprospiraceae bacterium]|nr:lamin tail domain-containing protein [Saprospiraceae bacterium]